MSLGLRHGSEDEAGVSFRGSGMSVVRDCAPRAIFGMSARVELRCSFNSLSGADERGF